MDYGNDEGATYVDSCDDVIYKCLSLSKPYLFKWVYFENAFVVVEDEFIWSVFFILPILAWEFDSMLFFICKDYKTTVFG